MDPAITIKPFESYRITIPVADRETRRALAAEMQQLVDNYTLTRIYTTTTAVIAETTNTGDGEVAITFAKSWLAGLEAQEAA